MKHLIQIQKNTEIERYIHIFFMIGSVREVVPRTCIHQIYKVLKIHMGNPIQSNAQRCVLPVSFPDGFITAIVHAVSDYKERSYKEQR